MMVRQKERVARISEKIRRTVARAESKSSDESGAVLILALIFLVSVSLIVTALLSFVGTSLSATSAFNDQRNLEYAATSTVNLAIQQTRTAFNSSLLEASPPQPCWTPDASGNSDLTINGYTINVWCSMIWNPFSGSTRIVTYSACPATNPSAITQPPKAQNDPTLCAASPLLQAQETFDDYAANTSVSQSPVNCTAINSCGQTQTQNSWLWNPIVPQVTSIVNASGSTTGGTTVTVNGSGFVNGSTVNFVWETGPNPESWTDPKNQANKPELKNGAGTIVPATNVQPPTGNGTQLVATAPAVTTGPYFFVTVTTPGGTSAYFVPGTQTPIAFTYTPAPPTINSNGLSGILSVSGGGLVTIKGSNFFNASNFPTQVTFVQGNTSALATAVTIDPSGTSLTAISPAVSSAGNWNVQVSTVGGTVTAPQTISLGVQQPIITGVSPASSNATPAQITITGANFLSGSSVWFCLTTRQQQRSNPA